MVRTKSVVRLGYTTRKDFLTADNIDDFQALDNRRDIKTGVVNEIFNGLRNGVNYESPWVVNKKKGKVYMIDCNHRHAAVKKYLAAFPNNKVEVTLHIYTDLNEDEEKAIFTQWNKGRKQSTADVVRQYQDEIEIYGMMQKNFPVGITAYGGSSSIGFYKLVSAYLAAIEPKFKGGYYGSPWKFIEECQDLGQKDSNLMAAFMKDFETAFGPFKNNLHMRTTPFLAIMRIWMDNKGTVPYTKMMNFFKLKIRNDAVAEKLGGMGGAKACVFVRDEFLRMLNSGRTNHILIKKEEMLTEPSDLTELFEEA